MAITITPHAGPIKIIWRGHVVAASDTALDLKEGGAAPVLYVPRADADMSFFERTARTSHCPHKGDANYFTLHQGTDRAENAVWSYETPIADVAPIGEHLAFYTSQVTIEG